MKLCTRGFSESQIMHYYTKFQNANWRILYDASKCEKLLVLEESRYSGIFKITGYESKRNIQKFPNVEYNMVDQDIK